MRKMTLIPPHIVTYPLPNPNNPLKTFTVNFLPNFIYIGFTVRYFTQNINYRGTKYACAAISFMIIHRYPEVTILTCSENFANSLKNMW